MQLLKEYGFDAQFEAQAASLALPGQQPARVVEELKNHWRVVTAAGERLAEAAGRLRYAAATRSDLPAAGDWVVVSLADGGERAVIHAVAPRRTALVRRAAGRATGEQVVAANVDTVFIATALAGDFNPRRLERYLALVWESGARPVVLLTKADLCADLAAAMREAGRAAMGAPVAATSAADGTGLAELERWLAPRATVALVGSSGVGKTTLINRLLGRRLGEELLATLEVRATDGRGRHATTSRQLLRLPGGALLVDTPGMRELGLWEADEGLGRAFTELEELAAACRFRDCTHAGEPGCAVEAAIATGALDPARLENWRKLGRELEFTASKRDARLASERERRWRQIHREMRRHPKPRF